MFRVVLCLLAAITAAPALAADPPKKILLVSSGPDGHPRATHEYVAGLDILAACLKPVAGIEVTHVKADGPWKEGPDLVGRSDCVVLFLTEGAKWLSADAKRLEAFRQHAKRGGGLVVLHWAMGTREAGPIDAFVELFGGCHGGPDRKFKVLETSVSVADPKNPITTGIRDFKVHDEFYYKLKFPKEKSKIQPVLLADIDGSKETVAWSFDRPDGGRSFGFSGLHFHDNWKREDYRRLVTQGVLWTVKFPTRKVDITVPESAFQLEKK